MSSSAPTRAAPGPSVLVLLPVYNGERFLDEQLASVMQQSGVTVHLLCRDDGSTDRSPELLRQWQSRWPQRIRIMDDLPGNRGASGNFSLLMQRAMELNLADEGPARYIALCDQDDLWHPDKLSTGLAQLQHLEQRTPGRPALVHSDLRVIADDGSEIAPSMARYQGLRVDLASFPAQLLSNTLTGCTSLMNRALLEKALPVPPQAIMHDWWLSLAASALGTRSYLDRTLIDYRQHASNTIGAKAQDRPVAFRSIFHRLFDDRHGEIFRLNARQAAAFLDRYHSELTGRQRLAAWLTAQLDVPFPPVQRTIFRLVRRL